MKLNDINLLEPQSPIIIAPQPSKPKNRAVFYIIILLIIAGGVYSVSKFYTKAKLNNKSAGQTTQTLKPKLNFFQAVKNFFFHPNDVLQVQKEGVVNILLLGIGGEGHDGPYLSDTNIIASIKPETNQVALISIPRDLGVKIDGYGTQRINYANALGESLKSGDGGEYARKTFEKTFGVSIPYYVRVDFKAFKDLVEAVDGIEINAPTSFTDYSFPGPNDSYQTVSFKAGLQKMNGEQALMYARSRHGTNGEGTDFARAKRQQLVIAALKEKMLSAGTYLNPIKIQKIIESLSTHLTTNLNFEQMTYLAGLARASDNNVKTFVLDNSADGFLTDYISSAGAYMLQPKGENFETIKTAIANIFESTSTPTFSISSVVASADTGGIATTTTKTTAVRPFSSAKIEIQNGTWYVGLASKYKQTLTDKGFSISSFGNCSQRPVTNTIIYLINPNAPKEIVDALNKNFQAHVTSVLPSWLTTNRVVTSTDGSVEEKYKINTDILLILGVDAVK